MFILVVLCVALSVLFVLMAADILVSSSRSEKRSVFARPIWTVILMGFALIAAMVLLFGPWSVKE